MHRRRCLVPRRLRCLKRAQARGSAFECRRMNDVGVCLIQVEVEYRLRPKTSWPCSCICFCRTRVPAGKHRHCCCCNAVCDSAPYGCVGTACGCYGLASSDFCFRCCRLFYKLDCDHDAVRAVRADVAAMAPLGGVRRMATGARSEEQGSTLVVLAKMIL